MTQRTTTQFCRSGHETYARTRTHADALCHQHERPERFLPSFLLEVLSAGQFKDVAIAPGLDSHTFNLLPYLSLALMMKSNRPPTKPAQRRDVIDDARSFLYFLFIPICYLNTS